MTQTPEQPTLLPASPARHLSSTSSNWGSMLSTAPPHSSSVWPLRSRGVERYSL